MRWSPRTLSIAAAVLAIGLTAPAQAEPGKQMVYRVGNSLTWDSRPKGMMVLAEQRGIEQTQAWHINCGKWLERIWTHPEEVCVDPVEPYGLFRQALPNHEWDAVTIQPYPARGQGRDVSTLQTDTRRTVGLIELARSEDHNKDTRFYVYAGWPSKVRGPYHEAWTAELPDGKPVPTRLSRAYFQHLLPRVRERTEANVGFIPVGEVLFELGRKARSGDLPGHSDAHDLYRDRFHLNGVGRFTAALTTFAVICDEAPHGITKPEGHYGKAEPFTPAVYEAIYESIEKVLGRGGDGS